ncbi:MAG: LacI family transcriptional regulator [Victivallaceae bacterium]|nr:LacI family transcriptional regulator [Victivallaceae bacterium]
MKKSASIKTIAEVCKVSPMTVSRALRNNSSVRESTRLRIVETAEQLGYIGSPRMGRPALINNKRSSQVEVIIGVAGEDITTFHGKLLAVIEQRLALEGCDCIVRICSRSYEQFLVLQENVRNSTASATLLIGDIPVEYLRALLDVLPDAILIDSPECVGLEMPYESFSFDNVQAAKIGVSHLLDSGREDILLLTGFDEHFFSQDVIQGYREILAIRGITVNDKLIRYADFTPTGAYQVMQQLLAEKIKFDAVFTSDEMASGIYRALSEHGLNIPDDIAICGCDGLPLGTHLLPQLTTVMLDYEALGNRAIAYLLHERSKDHARSRVRLLPHLELRESS